MTTEQYQLGYEAGYSEGFDAGVKPDDGYITIPRETFDQMQRALENAIELLDESQCYLRLMPAFCNLLRGFNIEGREALSAAKAVSEPKACDMGAMCLDCQPRGKNGECPDQQPQAQGEAAYWAEVIGMFVARLNNGTQTVATSDVLALLNDCQYLASLTHPQASEPAWMPIETAPKDGAVFLGLHGYKVREAYRVQRDDCEMWCFGGASGDVKIAPWTKPTHWMPLPAAPEATK